MDHMPKLGGYRPDATMPGASSHDDLLFVDNKHKLIASPSYIQEKNGLLDLRLWCSLVEDQARAGSCVGNSVVGALELLMIRDGIPFQDLSRLFVYYNSRLMHGEQESDHGTYIRLAIGTLSAIGTCTEAKWPYDLNNLFLRPTWGSYREAYAFKCGSYYSITGNGLGRIEQIKDALKTGNPVVFGMTVCNDFVGYTGGVMPMPKKTRINTGGHAMMICGYDDNLQCYIVRNSWGQNWGISGYALIPYDYLDASDANDCWCITSVK
jgi:C1A family cysteine protease